MSQSQAYQEFLFSLEKLNNEFLIGSEDMDIPSLKAQFQTIKAFFQNHLASLTIEDLDEAIAMQWQGIQTELYRELRLLETDILFFASSRAAATKLQRLQSLRQRTERMIKYCEVILKLL